RVPQCKHAVREREGAVEENERDERYAGPGESENAEDDGDDPAQQDEPPVLREDRQDQAPSGDGSGRGRSRHEQPPVLPCAWCRPGPKQALSYYHAARADRWCPEAGGCDQPAFSVAQPRCASQRIRVVSCAATGLTQ